MKRYIASFCALMLGSLLLTVESVSAQADKPENDRKIRQELMKKFSDDKKLSGVNVMVEDGVVTLFGTVPNVVDKQEAEKKAKKVDHVTRVNNMLNVMAFSGRDTDEAILREAVKRIRTDPFYSIYDDVNLSVNDGVITLSGEVWQPARKPDYEKRLSDIPGVKRVRNELVVSPTSPMDDRLRYRLTRAVYSHPAMTKYAMQPDPPIHIIVHNQRVTLTGVVNSEVDKALAESIVRGFSTFEVINNLRVEGKAIQ